MFNNLKLLKNLDLLFVEDDVSTAQTTIETLSYLFKNVHYAKNGIEALELYRTTNPDMILTDIKMPQMDGIEFARLVRQKDYITPIIFLTSFSDQKFLMDAVNLSTDGYFVKPINLDDMNDVLSRVVKRSNYIQKNFSIGSSAVYNLGTKELLVNNEEVTLGVKEQALLKLFINNSNETVSKEDINYCLYSLDSVGDTAIKNLVSRLKDKLGENSISHIRGSGWKLNIEN